MANKRVSELQDASLPLQRTDKILVSRDGSLLTKANASDLPLPLTTQQTANPDITGVAAVGNGKIYGEDGQEIPIGGAPTSTFIQAVQAATSGTPASGAFVAMPDVACNMVRVNNYTGADIEYQIDGSGVTIPVPDGSSRDISGITNANQIGWRLLDWADGPVQNVAQTRRVTVSGQAFTQSSTLTRAGGAQVQIVSGGSFTAFPDLACLSAEILNTSGKAVRVRKVGTTQYLLLKNMESTMLSGITNLNQIEVQPDDGIADIGLIKAEAFNNANLSAPLSTYRKAFTIDPSAKFPLSLQNYPTQLKGLNFGTVAQLRNLGKRAVPKGRKILTSFQSVAKCNGSTATMADVVGYESLYGSGFVEYTQGAAGSPRFRGDEVLATPVDVSNHSIRARIAIPYNNALNYLSVANAYAAFKIRLFSAGSPASPSANYHEITLSRSTISSGQMLATTDNGIIYEIGADISTAAAVGTGATLTAITYAELMIDTVVAGAVGSKIRLFDISAVPRVKSKTTIMFAGDDISIAQWTNFAPLMRKYGYPWMLGVDSLAKIGSSGFMTLDQLQQLVQRDGCEIIYQNMMDETTVDMSPEMWLSRASEFIVTAKTLGLGDVLHGSYGFNSNTNIDDERIEATKRVFKTLHLFMSGSNANPPLPRPELQPFVEPYRVKRMNVGGFTAGTFLQRWKDHIDQAVAVNGVAFFGFHTDFASGEALTELPNLLEYIRSLEIAGSVEVQTINQFCEQVY